MMFLEGDWQALVRSLVAAAVVVQVLPLDVRSIGVLARRFWCAATREGSW